MRSSFGYSLCLTSALIASAALASSHREAPGTTKTPKIDATDFYIFNSYEPGRGAFTTLIANYQPFQAPYGGPNYFTMDPDAIYEIQIDNVGDGAEHLTFQFKFTNALLNNTGETLSVGGNTVPIALRAIGPVAKPNDPNQGETESFTVNMITGNRRSGTSQPVTNATGGSATFAKPLDNIGNKTIANYATYAQQFIYNVTIPGCSTAGRMFVGQREEAFAVALGEIFDLVNFVPIEGDSAPGAGDKKGFPGGITQDPARNQLIGKYNVTSLALEVPTSCLVGSGNGVIGGWTSASLPQASLQDPSPAYEKQALVGGAYVQKSRLGMPLVNELVIGLNQKDLFNASSPNGDAQFATYVNTPTFPAILNALFLAPVNSTLGTSLATLAPTNFPRTDLAATYLTGFAGLNQMSTVTPSEMTRLNTKIAATPQAGQSTFGVVGGDMAGFPNGRRPGDDVVDITLRVAMGRLCYPVPINGAQTNLGLCTQDQAPVGNVAFTDGAPVSALGTQNAFPYLNNPIPGSPQTATNAVSPAATGH